MPRATIWIKKENEEWWSNLKNKSAWVNEMIAVERGKVVDSPDKVGTGLPADVAGQFGLDEPKSIKELLK